jgi:hypothetical protein
MHRFLFAELEGTSTSGPAGGYSRLPGMAALSRISIGLRMFLVCADVWYEIERNPGVVRSMGLDAGAKPGTWLTAAEAMSDHAKQCELLLHDRQRHAAGDLCVWKGRLPSTKARWWSENPCCLRVSAG